MECCGRTASGPALTGHDLQGFLERWRDLPALQHLLLDLQVLRLVHPAFDDRQGAVAVAA